MKPKNVFSALLLLLLLSAAWIAFQEDLASPYLINLETSDALESPYFGWNLITQKDTNATFWWLGFTRSLKEPLLDPAFWTSLVMLFLLLYTNGTQRSSTPKWQAAIISGTCLLLLISTIGPDYIAVNFLIQCLALLLLFRTLNTDIAAGLWLALIFAAGSLVLCSQWGSFALFSAVIILATHRKYSEQKGLALQHSAALVVLIVFLALVTIIQLRRPILPNFGYPATGRVVSDDGLPGIISPLLGETSEIPYINRDHIKKSLQQPVLFLTCFGVLFFLITGRPGKRVVPLSLILISALFWDTILPETLAQIGPLESLRRILPGLFPLPINYLAFALAICFFIVDLLQSRLMIVGFMLLLCWIAYPHGTIVTIHQRTLPDPLSPSDALVLSSPSFHLLSREGISIVPRLRLKRELRAHSIKDLGATISVSHNNKPKAINRMSDNRVDTRWSPNRGAQYGNEWIRISFTDMIAIEGIELLPGKFYSDFARGLQIVDCGALQGGNREITRIPEWQGGIELSNQGYPYYSGQHDVTIMLSDTVRTSCIQINQIGENQNFDWSIAELKVLTR